MTKRKRTPSPFPLPRAQAPFQIPASLQRLSMISRSLAHQADKLAGVKEDDKSASIVAQASAQDHAPSGGATTAAKTAGAKGHGQGFRAFAPCKRPSFPDSQTWVQPSPRGRQVLDAVASMAATHSSLPKGRVTPPSQRQQIPETVSRSTWPSLPILSDLALASLGKPPKDSESLCLETQPHQVAALIAHKRAENEANRKREAWTRRQAAAHRVSSLAPDGQLRSELNSTLRPSSSNQSMRASTGELQDPMHADECVTPNTATTFKSSIPSAAAQVDTRAMAPTTKASTRNKEPNTDQTSVAPMGSIASFSRDHDSSFSSSGLPSSSATDRRKPGGGKSRQSQLHPYQDGSSMTQLSGSASTSPTEDPKRTFIPFDMITSMSEGQDADTLLIRQSLQGNHTAPVAAGYHRFDPRDWQTGRISQPQGQRQPKDQPPSHNRLRKVPPHAVFRNLTQDKFGKFGVGGRLKEEVIGHQTGAATI